MKRNMLKFVIAMLMMVAIVAFEPTVSISAEAASAADDEHECEWDYIDSIVKYYFIDYNMHLYDAIDIYVCMECGAKYEVVDQKHEIHYDDDGDGMCICGTYID